MDKELETEVPSSEHSLFPAVQSSRLSSAALSVRGVACEVAKLLCLFLYTKSLAHSVLFKTLMHAAIKDAKKAL